MKRPGSAKTSISLPKAPIRLEKKSGSKPLPKAALRRESKRLGSLRKNQKLSRAFSRLSPEARRFTAHSRRRRVTIVSLLFSTGLLIVLVLSTIFTPLMAIETIEISGLKRLKESSVLNALKSEVGKPLPLINSGDVSKALEPFALIESFSLISLPPHTLLIEISERQPIGILLIGGAKYLYDPAGVRIGKALGSEPLPVIVIDEAPEDSKQFRAAIEVLLALPQDLLIRVSEINAKSKDDVVVRLRGYSAQRIIWGDQSDSTLKSKVLDALISNQKTSDQVTFDVSSPNAPVVRYGNF